MLEFGENSGNIRRNLDAVRGTGINTSAQMLIKSCGSTVQVPLSFLALIRENGINGGKTREAAEKNTQPTHGIVSRSIFYWVADAEECKDKRINVLNTSSVCHEYVP